MYHKHCLKCTVCNRRLDSMSLLEHNGEPFCNNCHRTYLGQGKDQFGRAVPLRPSIDQATMPLPKRSVSSSTPTSRSIHTVSSSTSAPKIASSTSTSSPGQRRPLPSVPSSTSKENVSFSSEKSSHSLGSASSSYTDLSRLSPKQTLHTQAPQMLQSTPLCARCHTPVCTYSRADKLADFAEQKQAAGRKWHRGCLRCDGCHASLDPNKVEEGPTGLVDLGYANTWCRACYSKVWARNYFIVHD